MSYPHRHRIHSRFMARMWDLSLPAEAWIALLTTSLPVSADVTVRFVESAPKDRFEILNTGTCAEGALEVTIDLSTAPSGLIFDTTGAGAGVEVFQPFEVAAGADVLVSAIAPADGDQAVTLALSGLAPGARFAFTVDVDDTRTASELGQTRVSDAEIAGAQVTVNGQAAAFGGDAVARLPGNCLS